MSDNINCTLPPHQQQQQTSIFDRYNTQTEGHVPSFDIHKMSEILYGPEFNRFERMEVYKIFDNPELLSKRLYTLDTESARKFVEKQAKIILPHPSMASFNIKREPIKIVHRISMCGMLNCSLGTKVGVQAGLYCISILCIHCICSYTL
jgi:hypothetical protein